MAKYEMCITSRPLVTLLVLSVLATILIPEPTEARPSGLIISRRKRVSDQRLAELETLLGLSTKMKGKVIVIPVGYGVIDPAKVGRKRRSASDDSLNKLSKILQIDRQDSTFLPEENNEILSLPLKDASGHLEIERQY
ncbi:PREDICTED: uncharacterized protein LOC107071355 [Polistes dominula]|uniref:Uncharacterized protein LOC107071355 n=1 Tax=Polistes dominula TaxID=743375 RepID=A0ABM1J002_POLDO|nr:PREDICTED: uncharacterized protein LOC107071355 [Polistes dominula]